MALTSSQSGVKSTHQVAASLTRRLARRGAEEVVAPGPATVIEPTGVVAHAPPHAGGRPERAEGNRRVGHLVEAVVDRRPGDERDRAALGRGELAGRIIDLWRDVDEDGATAQVRSLRREADRRGPAERHADDAPGGGRHRLHERSHRLGVLPRPVVAVGPPVGVPVPRQVDGDRRTPEGQHDGVPRVPVLGPSVQEDELGLALTPAQVGQCLPRRQCERLPGDDRLPFEGDVPLGRVLVEEPELVVVVRAQGVPHRRHRGDPLVTRPVVTESDCGPCLDPLDDHRRAPCRRRRTW